MHLCFHTCFKVVVQDVDLIVRNNECVLLEYKNDLCTLSRCITCLQYIIIIILIIVTLLSFFVTVIITIVVLNTRLILNYYGDVTYLSICKKSKTSAKYNRKQVKIKNNSK